MRYLLQANKFFDPEKGVATGTGTQIDPGTLIKLKMMLLRVMLSMFYLVYLLALIRAVTTILRQPFYPKVSALTAIQ